jgi:hypothetical protein
MIKKRMVGCFIRKQKVSLGQIYRINSGACLVSAEKGEILRKKKSRYAGFFFLESYIFLPPYAAPAKSSRLTPPSKGTGQGGKGPPHGDGGPIPIPIPMALTELVNKGDTIKNAISAILKLFFILCFLY